MKQKKWGTGGTEAGREGRRGKRRSKRDTKRDTGWNTLSLILKDKRLKFILAVRLQEHSKHVTLK